MPEQYTYFHEVLDLLRLIALSTFILAAKVAVECGMASSRWIRSRKGGE